MHWAAIRPIGGTSEAEAPCLCSRDDTSPHAMSRSVEAQKRESNTGVRFIGVNVMRFDLQPDADTCHFAVCGCRATDFIIESADTYATAAGGGFRASSPRRPRRTSPVKAGGRR